MTKFIDFNDLATGTVVDNEYASQGVTISAAGGAGKAMIFNTASPTGGDHDLRTTNLGKALIISEDGDSGDPDDNASGGTFTFAFDTPADVNRLTFLDIEEGARIKFFDAQGNLIEKVNIAGAGSSDDDDDDDDGPNGDNGQMIVDFDVAGVARMEVTLHGSGAIDNLVWDDSGPDGIVENDNDGDLIDLGYVGDPDGDRIDAGDAILPGEAADDDIVDAMGGDDTIKSEEGDDVVYAGSGDDSVHGGAGDDLIFGDSNYAGPGAGTTTREVFEWDGAGVGNNGQLGGFTQNTGNVDVTFSILTETGAADTTYSTDKQNVSNIDADGDPVDNKSSLSSILNGRNNDADYALEFSDAVEHVSFRINDIDGDGVVTVSAFDADGNPITVLLEGGKRLTLKDTDGVPGNDTADSNGGYLPDTSNEYSLLVTIPGPVSKIVIEHDQNGGNNTGINITDVYFDAPIVDDGTAGNDVLKGGDGDDSIFGEDGDDTLKGENDDDVLDGGEGADSLVGGSGNDALTGGAGNDIVLGGADADTIFGGAGDVVDGGSGGFNADPLLNTDLDVLDLTGQGPFFLDNVTPDSNGNGINGTVVFVNPDGTPNGLTIEFTEIEEVLGDEINRGPDAVDDTVTTDEDTAVTIDVLANDTDPDGDPLTVTDASSPDGDVVINPDGTITFTPDENFNGDTTITYTIEDGNGGMDTAMVDVTVNPMNDDPVAVDDVASTDEDVAVVIDLIGNDTDVDGDPLDIGSVSVDPAEGSVVDNGDGTVTFTPAPDFNGTATITYTVVDGQGGSDDGEAIVSVGPVNDAPDAIDDTATTDEDTPVTIDVLANDTDVDGDPLEIVGASVPAAQGTVDIVGGQLVYTPAENFNGDAIITYSISDGNGGTDMAEVLVTVNPVNDDPVAEDDNAVTPFNTAVIVPVLANDTDVDGDMLTVIDATSPNGTVDINPDGTITFTPNNGFEGPAVVHYTVSDGNGGTDTAQVFITVEEQPLDGIVEGTDDGELIDENYTGDPEGDMVDNEDNIFSNDPDKANDDIIEAGGGDDTIEGGEGSDTIDGGSGDDLIDSSTGNLAPDKGFPNDAGTPIPGFPFGYPADDDPEDDRDFVDGGAGNDTISTGDDADTIVGGTGDDVIDGGIDDDEISGDDGADRIVGGEGNDLIEGGIGDDTIYAGNDPDLGLDQLDIEDDGSNPIFPADPVKDNGKDTVFGGEGNDVIFGADDDDELFGGIGNDYIDGQIDDDLIDGGDGDDTLIGGQGNDTILGGDGDDYIEGGLQKDTIDGGAGNDTILGGNGADVIDGGDGDDLIDGGTGKDTDLSGGAGNDTIFGATGSDTIDGGDGDDLIDLGHGGEDVASGGADQDTFTNLGAGDTIDGGGAGVDFDTLDLVGSAPPNGSLKVTLTNPDSNGNGFDGFVTYFDQDGNEAGTLTFTEIENVIPCFTPGTRIATPTGERRVEDLEVGDRVITRDNGIQEIRWVGRREMTGVELDAAPHLRPVLIRQGALGKGLPERDMLVSPQHRVLMSGEKPMLYFDESEVLVAAKHLTAMEGIDVVDVSETTYIHVMFDQHEVILSDGTWTESFQPGDMTLGAMGDAQRSEILELFPELATAEGIEGYEAARRSLKRHEAALLAQ